MISDESLGELFAKIGFKVDPTGYKQAQAMLKTLQKQAIATGKAIDKALKSTGGAGQAAKSMAVAQQAQTKAQFQQQLQNAKLSKINNTTQASGLKTQQQQVALQIKQGQLRAQQAKVQAAAQAAATKAQLQQHAQALGHQIQQSRIANLQQQHQIRAARQVAQQHAAARRAAGQTNNHNTGSRSAHGGGLLGVGHNAIHRFGGFGRMAGGIANGGGIGAIDALGGGLGRAATGLGAVAGSAALVVAAFAAVTAAAVGFGREAERISNTKSARMAQFKIATGSDAGSKAMEARFENFAQTEGISTKDVGGDYAKLVGALSKRMPVGSAQDSIEGILRYGKAQNLSSDQIQRLGVGIKQALGKNQLYSEEWTGQISEHLGANANELGAEAWQRATGGKKTGQDAQAQFLKDRTDKKIKGESLVSFFKELGAVMNSHANDGGALDKARVSQDSQDSRMSNQYQANMARAYDNTGLSKSMPEMYDNLTKVLNALDPQFRQVGESSSVVLNAVNGIVKGFTYLVNVMNSGNNFFDPKIVKDFSLSIEGLGASFSALLEAVAQTFGMISDTGAPQTAFKLLGEVIIGVVGGIVDVLTTIADVIIGTIRTIQDAQHAVGLIKDDRYSTIVAERKVVDDKRAKVDQERQTRADIRDGKIAPGTGIFPMPDQTPQQSPVLPPQLTGPTNGTVGVMALPPATPVVQPAINGQAAAAINTTNTITLNAAPITINGVAPDEVKGHIDQYQRQQEQMLQSALDKLSPARAAATQSQARGN